MFIVTAVCFGLRCCNVSGCRRVTASFELPLRGAWFPACRFLFSPPSPQHHRGSQMHIASQSVIPSSPPSFLQRVFPYVSAMVNNGSFTYDHDRDGRPTELGGCTAMVRNLNHDTFLVIRYVKRRLTILLDIDGKHEWRDCIDIPGVHLPRGYYFGVSSVTGDLSGYNPE